MEFSKNVIVNSDIEAILDSDIDFKKFNHSSILITGATGMLASYLILVFSKLNSERDAAIQLFALGRNINKAKSKFGEFFNQDYFHFIEQDISQPISDEVKNIDYIIHAASNASPWYMVNAPVEIAKANILGTFNVLEFAKKNGIKQVHFLSTREVYGSLRGVDRISEDEFGSLVPTNLRATYPESKRAAENLLVSYYNEYQVPFTSSRIAHAFGPGMKIENDGRIMSDLIGDVVKKNNIVLKSDGSAKRAFIYITDVITGILTIITKGKLGESYNLSNETEEISIKNLAELLVKLFPNQSQKVDYKIANITRQSQGYSEIKRIALNDEKLSDLGWSPEVSLKQGLTKTVSSYLEEDM